VEGVETLKAMELNKIYNENCLSGLKKLENNSIDCCISSPPYWGLRDYGVSEQIGNEKDFIDFIDNLIEIYIQVYRVLKPTGTCFINLGDTYGGSGSGTTKNADTSKYIENSKQVYVLPGGAAKSSKLRGTKLNKSLLMIPERFAIEMINNGWILRNQIIWHKPNQMPSSVTDRFTVDFEKIFFFVKQSNYFFTQQLEKSIWAEHDKRSKVRGGVKSSGKCETEQYAINKVAYREDGMRNIRTVWSINTKPFSDSHFAVFPETLVKRMINAGCPEGGVVLDPFMGAGTTAITAKKLNRNYIGFELNKDYIEITNKRLYNEFGIFN
jgi:DNA modification methylase